MKAWLPTRKNGQFVFGDHRVIMRELGIGLDHQFWVLITIARGVAEWRLGNWARKYDASGVEGDDFVVIRNYHVPEPTMVQMFEVDA